ncbi:MAG: hypothetical protein QM705_01110 [Ancrocorticia sp.]
MNAKPALVTHGTPRYTGGKLCPAPEEPQTLRKGCPAMTTRRIGYFSRCFAAAAVALMTLASCGTSTVPVGLDDAYTKAEPGDEIIVDAIVHRDGTGTYLCSASLESYPPQCGGTRIELVDVDAESLGLTAYPLKLEDGSIDAKDTVPVLQGEVTVKVSVESKETWRYLELVEAKE